MTTDIDVVVRGDETTPAAVLRTLATRRIVPRIDDAEAFARERLVLLLRHAPTGVDLDLSFGWTTFEHEALEACSTLETLQDADRSCVVSRTPTSMPLSASSRAAVVTEIELDRRH